MTLRSVVRVVPVADPAAGSEVVIQVPGGVFWRVLSLTARLVASVAVANRQVNLVMDDVTTVFCRIPPTFSQTAGQTEDYTWARGVTQVGAGLPASNLFPLPDLILPPVHRIRTITTALDVADDWGAPGLLVAEFDTLEKALRGFEFQDELAGV